MIMIDQSSFIMVHVTKNSRGIKNRLLLTVNRMEPLPAILINKIKKQLNLLHSVSSISPRKHDRRPARDVVLLFCW